MAAGAVVFYQHAIEDMMKGALDLASMTLEGHEADLGTPFVWIDENPVPSTPWIDDP